MVVKSKDYFQKTRNNKNNDKSYEDIEMQHIMKKYYQIKRNSNFH